MVDGAMQQLLDDALLFLSIISVLLGALVIYQIARKMTK